MRNNLSIIMSPPDMHATFNPKIKIFFFFFFFFLNQEHLQYTRSMVPHECWGREPKNVATNNRHSQGRCGPPGQPYSCPHNPLLHFSLIPPLTPHPLHPAPYTPPPHHTNLLFVKVDPVMVLPTGIPPATWMLAVFPCTQHVNR